MTMAMRAKKHNQYRPLMAIVAVLMVTLPLPAAAFDMLGVHLWGDKKAPSANIIGEPKYYKIDVVGTSGDETQKTVQEKSALFADKDKPTSGSSGLIIKARSDYRRILVALYAQGRYGGDISITVNGREVRDISPDQELPTVSRVVIKVNSGPEYYFQQANFNQVPSAAYNEKYGLQAYKGFDYSRGQVAKSTTILKAEQYVVDAWRQKGYAKARVVNRQVTADHAARTVMADMRVEPGRKARYGPLRIDNVSESPRMNSAYVAWMTGLKKGELYSPEALSKASGRLAKLGMFQETTFQEGDNILPDSRLPLTLVLNELALHRVGGGGNYSTSDGTGLEAYWIHRNLFGQAENLRLDAKVKGIGRQGKGYFDPKNYNYTVGTTFTRPGVFTPDTDLSLNLKGEREVLSNYTTTSLKGQIGLAHKFDDQLSGRLYFNATQSKNVDGYFGSRKFFTLGLLMGLLYDSRNNAANASDGHYFDMTFEPQYESKYGDFVSKAMMENRGYWALDEDEKMIVASRLKLGTLSGGHVSELPSDMLFFAGGGGSVRGYGYNNIGIHKNGGAVIGGRSLVEGALELRAMLNDTIGFVAFGDTGTVGEKSYPNFAEKTKVGVGIGARYLTSFGPLRFDFARPLDRRKDDPKYGIYIAIGQAF